MNYVPPYSKLREKFSVNSKSKELNVNIKLEEIEKFIRLILLAIPVDEAWYRRTYPDIDEAIERGLIRSGREHFVRDGYFEGRRPFAMTVDEDWYLSNYDDIASAVSAGVFPSARDHFASHGYEEGRMPCRLF
jgi:hypothetical protein